MKRTRIVMPDGKKVDIEGALDVKVGDVLQGGLKHGWLAGWTVERMAHIGSMLYVVVKRAKGEETAT